MDLLLVTINYSGEANTPLSFIIRTIYEKPAGNLSTAQMALLSVL
jgi:hypothetical protein